MRFTSRARFGSDNATCKRRECSIDAREEGVALRNHQTGYDTTLDGHDLFPASTKILRRTTAAPIDHGIRGHWPQFPRMNSELSWDLEDVAALSDREEHKRTF